MYSLLYLFYDVFYPTRIFSVFVLYMKVEGWEDSNVFAYHNLIYNLLLLPSLVQTKYLYFLCLFYLALMGKLSLQRLLGHLMLLRPAGVLSSAIFTIPSSTIKMMCSFHSVFQFSTQALTMNPGLSVASDINISPYNFLGMLLFLPITTQGATSASTSRPHSRIASSTKLVFEKN